VADEQELLWDTVADEHSTLVKWSSWRRRHLQATMSASMALRTAAMADTTVAMVMTVLPPLLLESSVDRGHGGGGWHANIV
jgi:hypothetical protein